MVPEDLERIDHTLRELRPSLPEDRLQRTAARARTAARRSDARRNPTGKESFVRSRLAITLMLILGFSLSGAGAGLAVSGVGGEAGTSSEAQYPDMTTTVTPEVTTTPETKTPPTLGGEVKGDTEEGGEAPGAGEAPTGGGAAPVADEVQEHRQLGAQAGGSLPFTGLAAIPILLVGLALTAAGLVLRRGTGRDSG